MNARSFSDRLARLIETAGPVSVARYMAEANAHYYSTRDPLGAEGDFITAPEISQMFGELVGAWLTDMWIRAGRPDAPAYAELGPGRGTLAADALRTMRRLGLDPAVHFIETSPLLREAQAEAVPEAAWADRIADLQADGPLLIVANEFFDALPVHQLASTEGGWRELVVGFAGGRFERAPGPPRPNAMAAAAPGTIVETSPASIAIARETAQRLASRGGTALIVDYGPARSGTGDTLQAVSKHGFADPWTEPGERDLTAHVDFEALGAAARGEGVRVFGPRAQGEWLEAMGIGLRAEALARAAPGRAAETEAARERLVSPAQMGELFKMMAFVAQGWPEPAGFA